MLCRLRLLALALFAPLACLDPYITETSASGGSTTTGTSGTLGTSSGATTSTSSSTSCSTSSSSGAVDPDDTACAFICDTRDHPPGWCDLWNDDCPEGQRCALVSLDGDNAWETSRCVPLAATPDALYEPCTLLGTGSDGLDTCDRHTICTPKANGDTTPICIGLCTGSSEAPVCADPDAKCIEGGPPYGFCFPPCDPLSQDCGDGSTCVPNPGYDDHFMCVSDASDEQGHLFDPCDYANACDPGLFCAESSTAVECDPKSPGCCLPFCDLDEPNTCPGAGQQCIPWYTDHCDAASFNADVGACALP